MYQNDAQKVLTCEVRFSYANLVNPRKINDNDPNEKAKYSVTLLIPKTEQACIDDIMQAIQAAHNAAINTVWGGAQPQYAPIIHDGDGLKPDGTAYGEECKGCWVLNASTVNKPQVVHQSNINVELAPQDIYSGMYGRATIRFYGYNNRAKGVACGLGNIMKTKDGEPLAGGASAAADFAGLEATPAPVGAVPGMGQATQYGAAQAMPTQAAPAPAPAAPVQYPNYGAVPQQAAPAPQQAAPVQYPQQGYPTQYGG